MSKGKWVSPTREWEEYGLSYQTYRYRLKKGIPLNAPKKGERFSGLDYSNSPEKLDAIREKYKNGVSMDTLSDFVDILMGVDKQEGTE